MMMACLESMATWFPSALQTAYFMKLLLISPRICLCWTSNRTAWEEFTPVSSGRRSSCNTWCDWKNSGKRLSELVSLLNSYVGFM